MVGSLDDNHEAEDEFSIADPLAWDLPQETLQVISWLISYLL